MGMPVIAIVVAMAATYEGPALCLVLAHGFMYILVSPHNNPIR